MTGFEAVIFDLDGLLLDTERMAIEAGITALASMGHDVTPTFMASLIGTDHAEGLRRLNTHIGVDLDEHAVNVAWSEAMQHVMIGGVPLKPGALELLDRLDTLALPYAVATNSARASALRKLERSDLAGRIAMLTGFDEVARGKPAPDVYLEAVRRLGHTPSRCLAFEDSDLGTAAAHAAGMTVVQVPDLCPPRTDLAHHVARTLRDGANWAGLFG